MSSTPRFFVPVDAIRGDEIVLPPEAGHHARNVLRLRSGAPLLIHDGAGTVYHCVLTEPEGRSTTARIMRSEPARSEPRTRVTVAQALPKTPDKVEQVLQHGTEVGAAGFVLFAAHRSVARLASGDKIEKRLSRWLDITRGAAEQSGRGLLPTVEWLPSPEAVSETLRDYDAALVLHEGASLSLRSALDSLSIARLIRLLIIVGPEGGLTDEEVARFADRGANAVTLGPRVLRTETAALVGLAQILFARED